MSILRKPLSQITAADIQALCDNGAAETAELEFKGQLPAEDSRSRPDPWLSGGKLGDYAKRKIIAEIVAFANAQGGTLVLGVEETDSQPRQATKANALPRCRDLARRIVDICEDMIEPRLPLIAAEGIPSSDTADDGFIIVRVASSADAPHRSKGDREYYVRRGEVRRQHAD